MGEKLTKTLRKALGEVASYRGRNLCYWGRRASMGALAELGLVEMYRPPSMARYRGKEFPYRITEAGLAALKDNPNG